MSYDDKHEYDGIREADNPMPRWWVELFAATIAVSVFYYVAFQFFDEFRIDHEYAASVTEHRRREELRTVRAAQAALKEGTVAERTERLAHDPAAMGAGKAVYELRCAMCHGENGQGLVGPNLTDEYWLNGDGKPEAIAKVIAEGVDGKGMPPWKEVLSPTQALQVTAYVHSLRSTRPANGKPPQGTAYPP